MTNLRILFLLVAVAILAGTAGYATRMSISDGKDVDDTGTDVDSSSLAQPTAKPLWYWEFDNLDGEPQLLSKWQGPLLVINFWATWCPPCLKEIPSFVSLQDKFGASQVQFIGIAYDHAEAVVDFEAKTNINYPILLGGDDVAVFMRELGNKIGALPFTAVVDGQGQVVATHQGEWHEKDVLQTLNVLLSKKTP